MDAALGALIAYRSSDASGMRSSIAGQLHRAEMALTGGPSATSSSAAPHRFDHVSHVERALEQTYAGGRGGLGADEAAAVLLARLDLPGQSAATWESLVARYGVRKAALRELVHHGRAFIGAEPTERGLVGVTARRAGTAPSMRGTRERATVWRAPQVA